MSVLVIDKKTSDKSISNFEVLRETKVAYEYINNILKYSDIRMDTVTADQLKTSSEIISDLYGCAYSNLEKNMEERNELKVDDNCPNCNNNLLISDLIDYDYLCNDCDENFYSFEVGVNNKWYIIDQNQSMYETEFKVRIRDPKGFDEGLSFYPGCQFNDLDSAIKKAQEVSHNFEECCVEIVDNKGKQYYELGYIMGAMYEEYCIEGITIDYVDKEMLNKYIDCWINHRELPISNEYLCCDTEDCIIAVDNSSGECYVEEFDEVRQAREWLLGKEIDEIEEMKL